MSFLKRFFVGMQEGKNFISLSDLKYLPRWLVLWIDVFIVFMAVLLSFYVSRRFDSNHEVFFSFPLAITLILAVNVGYMFLFRTYSGIVRHSTFIDLSKILISSCLSALTVGFLNSVIYFSTGTALIIPTIAFLTLFTALSCMMLFVFRLLVKEAFHLARELKVNSLKKNLLVLGTDEQSVAIARVVLDSTHIPYNIIGFISERDEGRRAYILGKPILTREKLERNGHEPYSADGVLMVRDNMDTAEMDQWVTLFLEKGLKIYKAPALQKIRDKNLGHTIRKLQIEDLLNRKPIRIENREVHKRHYQKSILVTGGAGSIGSEIVRQIAQFDPALVVVLDQAETPLYEIELEMREKFPSVNFLFVMMDIVNRNRLEQLFSKYDFSMVYHAAAYKHVPLVEENPHEAVVTNVMGSMNLAELSSRYHVNRFVMISTDKAVNPTNVMGATKRTAELYVQALQNTPGNTTKFITTRFGNVLGSNGSVIKLFQKQIQKGGPVTITHPDIVRYFMTIQEACELVLQAGTMGIGGEVFVFDMGEPVKILNLAKRMIRLSGLRPDEDIKIVYTGLRPGEKLYEELLTDTARNMPTPHEKIMISKDKSMEFEEISRLVHELLSSASGTQKFDVVRILKIIVPEYKSNNSIFQRLD
ncbi:nucleoside-diphosphate sugar epimerase/dehydratase [Weeksellaceae bacterium A-14]